MKRILLALIVVGLMFCGLAHAELAAPQNPSWKAGSTATATWDAVEGADYYELTVYVYDEAGTKLLGTTTTGTSINEVDVQLEANTIIKQQETEYATVKLAYTVKAGVADDKGEFAYGAESAMAEMWEYTFTLIQLQPPENIVLHEDGTASWKAVDGVETYLVRLYGYVPGDEPNSNAGIKVLAKENEADGIVGFDFSEEMIDQYSDEVRLGHIENGTQLNFCITVLCISPDENQYITSADSEYSNAISYVNSNLIQLQPPENIVLHEDGTASWEHVEGVNRYGVRIYGYKVGGSPNGSSTTNVVAINNMSGIETHDFTEDINDVYHSAVRLNKIKKGEVLNICITVYSDSSNNSQYITSDDSAYSNTIPYTPFTPVEAISLSPSKPALYVGNSYTLGKTITPEDGYYTTIDWSSSNSGVVTVNSDGRITGVAAGDAQVTAAIGDVKTTVPVKVYTISSNIESDKDKDHVTDSAGDIIDDIINNPDPDLGDTDIPQEDMEDIKDQVTEGIWRGDEFFTDMKWYEENFEKYRNNWGQIQKAARELNEELDVQFAGAYNITVEMYHKDKQGSDHKIGCIEEFENEITFTFDLFSSMNEVQTGYARRYILVRIHRNEIEAIDMEVENGKGKAKSKGFSDFVVLYVDEPTGSVDLTGLKTLTLPGFLTEIEEEAFVGIAAEVVVIPESCTSIGARAFADCPNLTYIVLPVGSEITPEDDGFDGCNAEIIYK